MKGETRHSGVGNDPAPDESAASHSRSSMELEYGSPLDAISQQRIRTPLSGCRESAPDTSSDIWKATRAWACEGALLTHISDTDRSDTRWLSRGELVGDRYRVQGVAGLGEVSVVFEALDLRHDRAVALKFLRSSVWLSGEIQNRFRREMRISAKLSGQHCVRVYDRGEFRGVPFMTVELLRGETAAQRLQQHGPLPLSQVARWLLQTCEAVASGHGAGIVHGALEPASLFLQQSASSAEVVKVLRFASTAPLTSPLYLAPEQVVSCSSVDERSDVWALGVTFFTLLTGELPFKGRTHTEVARQILSGEDVSIRQMRPDLPAAVETLLRRCLQREPENRYPSVAELACDLSRLCGEEGSPVLQHIQASLGMQAGKWQDKAVEQHADAGFDSARQQRGEMASDSTTLLLNKRYRAVLQLGEARSADVSLAVTHGEFNKLVVLKSLPQQLASEAESVRIFVAEAKRASRLNHPNLIQVNDVFSDNGLPALVMEYVEGQPLAVVLERAGGELPLELHVWILCEVLAGLHYAHELDDYDGSALNLVHRELTPHDVFVSYDGQIKVLGVGISSGNGSHGRARDARRGLRVRYRAPEQVCAPTEIDRRVDVYAVGAMLWEAITREPLGYGLSEQALLDLIASGDIPSPTALAPACPPDLARICMTALARDVSQRYRTAAEFHAALEDFLNSRAPHLSSKKAAGFMTRHFAAERARMQRRIQALLLDLPKVRPTPAEPRKFPRPSRLSRARSANGVSWVTVAALLGTAAIASLVTWSMMRRTAPHHVTPPASSLVGSSLSRP